jgi:hypothetical protein
VRSRPKRASVVVTSVSTPVVEWREQLDNADEREMRPDAFGTLLLPVTDLNKGRDHQFYLSLWTRTEETTLFGKSVLHIKNSDDRCVWLFVRETTSEMRDRSTRPT